MLARVLLEEEAMKQTQEWVDHRQRISGQHFQAAQQESNDHDSQQYQGDDRQCIVLANKTQENVQAIVDTDGDGQRKKAEEEAKKKAAAEEAARKKAEEEAEKARLVAEKETQNDAKPAKYKSNAGELPGVFSVGANKKVRFSQGRLQFNPAKYEFRFAKNQYDIIGKGNEKIAPGLDGWIDLFGWSADNTTAPFGVSTSTKNTDYAGEFVDWGVNEINIDAPNTWRTLSKDEWEYLINERDNAVQLYGAACVNGVNGVMFMPDDWVCPAGVTFKAGFTFTLNNSDYAAHQVISAAQWAIMEGAGAIFLPAAGSDSLGVQSSGAYWSTTAGYSSYYAEYSHCMVFNNGHASTDSHERRAYSSVRLVKDL